ncbi:MAG: prepilin peptidase, partial [Chloroflexaceae bacterium]|nr:prepilin peptidase [Chloroflexaceae bacterium]
MLILVIVAGLLLGTLLNIIIIRLPREGNLLRWPLHCTRTGEALAWWQLLPVVGGSCNEDA